MLMSPLYYRLLYKMDSRHAFLIWLSDERDGVVVQDDRMPSFSSESSLCRFAAQAGLALVEEAPTLHDLDSVQAWALCPRRETLDCATTLAAWNLFGDITRSLPRAGASFSELDRAHGWIYEKLLFGNNLPAITQEGKRYEPRWSDNEVTALASTLDCGLQLFRLVRLEIPA